MTHGPGFDEPLILHTQNPATGEIKSDYYLSDNLGSVTELVGKDGTITGEQVFNSFGKIIHSSGIADAQCYSYTGREFDRESDLYFYRTRYYSSTLGNFITQDLYDISMLIILSRIGGSPEITNLLGSLISNPKKQNYYAYVSANPINFIDPQGLFGLTELMTVVAIYAIVVNVVLIAAAGIFYLRYFQFSSAPTKPDDDARFYAHILLGCQLGKTAAISFPLGGKNFRTGYAGAVGSYHESITNQLGLLEGHYDMTATVMGAEAASATANCSAVADAIWSQHEAMFRAWNNILKEIR